MSQFPSEPQQPTIRSTEETQTLIQTYQQTWYSLNRTQLNSTHWSYISNIVNSNSNLPKSPTQCRHKLEKLRKRYRLELLKPLHSISWPYFPLLHRLQHGPDHDHDHGQNRVEDESGPSRERKRKRKRKRECGWGDGMRDFVEMFVKMEKMKMEFIRDNERVKIEMDNKRLQMILVANQKSVDFVNKAFGLDT